jgi:hypothetical protein
MSVLEIEEFTTFENITKFLRSGKIPPFISRYFDRDPVYTAAVADVGGTVLTFQDHPLEIAIKGSTAELSIFIDFRLKKDNELKVLKFIDKNSTASDIIANFGLPDFEINEEKRIKLQHNAKVIKYFIDDKYSISFDYNEKIEMVRIFYDNYR